MSWAVVLATTWTMIAMVLALAIGGAVRVADRRRAGGSSNVPDFVPEE